MSTRRPLSPAAKNLIPTAVAVIVIAIFAALAFSGVFGPMAGIDCPKNPHADQTLPMCSVEYQQAR